MKNLLKYGQAAGISGLAFVFSCEDTPVFSLACFKTLTP
jgi:hypothetical protein